MTEFRGIAVLFFSCVLWLPAADLTAGTSTTVPTSNPATAPTTRYHLYWLAPVERSEYVDLLISTKPIGELSVASPDSTKPSADTAATIVRTYAKDSIWNTDKRPFRNNQTIQSVDVAKRTLKVNDKEYQYEAATLREVISLLEKPEGTIKIHRTYAPIAGAKDVIAELLDSLRKQQAIEKTGTATSSVGTAADKDARIKDALLVLEKEKKELEKITDLRKRQVASQEEVDQQKIKVSQAEMMVVLAKDQDSPAAFQSRMLHAKLVLDMEMLKLGRMNELFARKMASREEVDRQAAVVVQAELRVKEAHDALRRSVATQP